jgi:type II secretory pathway pseudopilin PulG
MISTFPLASVKRASGFTLVELIIFIVGLGILASTILLPLVVSLRSSPTGFSTLAAFEVAKGRMELIRMQSRANVLAATQDICPASTPTGYTVTSVIGAAPSPNNDTNQYKQVTVTVTGDSTVGNSYAQLISIVANY